MKAFIAGLVICAVLIGLSAAFFEGTSETVAQLTETSSTHVRL